MKFRSFICEGILAGIVLFLAYSCKKEAIKSANMVTISTVSNITTTSASAGGVVTA